MARFGRVCCGLWGLAIATMLAVMPPSPARAQGLVHELKFGVLAHDVPELWSGFSLEPADAAINLEAVLSPAFSFLGGTIRPVVGGSIALGNGTSSAYLDARWQYEMSSGLFFGLGLGAAIHDGALGISDPERKALGSRLLFHIPVEIGFRLDQRTSLSLYFEHMSNAGLANYNEGLDRIGVRYGVRF
ncbi:MAG: acyloxyacyl hydrolase [Hyphomicrobiaceae bacterium]|nr:acyloxyacyl hydrolase [Hyphomicrobiaceae bacterium]